MSILVLAAILLTTTVTVIMCWPWEFRFFTPLALTEPLSIVLKQNGLEVKLIDPDVPADICTNQPTLRDLRLVTDTGRIIPLTNTRFTVSPGMASFVLLYIDQNGTQGTTPAYTVKRAHESTTLIVDSPTLRHHNTAWTLDVPDTVVASYWEHKIHDKWEHLFACDDAVECETDADKVRVYTRMRDEKGFEFHQEHVKSRSPY